MVGWTQKPAKFTETVDPRRAVVPAAGSIFETTNAFGATSASRLYSTTNPASRSSAPASLQFLPTTSGIATRSGPFDTVSTTFDPGTMGFSVQSAVFT